MRIPRFLLAFPLLCLSLHGAEDHDLSALFPDGTRYTALGDSITRGGHYHSGVHLFLTTRFPEQKIDLSNAGISGDTAAGALKRLEWDVLPSDPTLVSIMFGMNDVGSSDIYGPTSTGPQVEEQRRKRLDTYEQKLRETVKRLRDKNARIILIAPSILDETVQSAATNYPGKNVALGEASNRVRKMAAEQNIPLVDFYSPMLEITQKLQTTNPAFSLIGKDRIHPDASGHFVMTYLFLKALNAPGEVASIVIDKTGGAASSNCAVDEITTRENGISFRYKAAALPFPVEDAARPALEWVPFTEDLNRETLTVRDLPAGAYRLEIDGKFIRNYTAADLSSGVNIATEVATPQHQQAKEVLGLFKKRWGAISKLRDIAFVEHGTCRELPHPLTLDQVKPKIEAWVNTAKGKPYEGFYKKCADAYAENKPREEELQAEANQAMTEIRTAAQPRSHQVSLTKSTAP